MLRPVMLESLKKKFHKILINKEVKDSKTARRFMDIFPDKIQIVEGEPEDIKKSSLTADEFSQSKKQIFVTRFKGRFLKNALDSIKEWPVVIILS